MNELENVNIAFDARKGTLTVKNIPEEIWSSLLTEASLFNSLSKREYTIEAQMNPASNAKANLEWVEGRRRILAALKDKYNKAVGIPSIDLDEYDDHNLKTWVDREMAYIATDNIPGMDLPCKPYLHVYRARLKMLELMQLVSYASQTIVGLCRRNHHHRPDFALSKLRLMGKLIREIIKHVSTFEAEFNNTKIEELDTQPIERGFGVI